jgi:hypothetical protein
VEAVDARQIPNADACAARFSGEDASGSVFDLVIVEDVQTNISGRVAYDEPRVIADSQISGSEIASWNGQGASAMERVVALNKHLIHTTVKPGKKLLFSSVVLSELIGEDAYLRVRLESRLGTRLYRSSIHVNENAVGEIIFYGV